MGVGPQLQSGAAGAGLSEELARTRAELEAAALSRDVALAEAAANAEATRAVAAACERQLDVLRGELDRQRAEFARLREALPERVELEAMVTELEGKVTGLEVELEGVRSQLEAMRRSRTWRVATRMHLIRRAVRSQL